MSVKYGDMVNHITNDTLDTLDNNSRLRMEEKPIILIPLNIMKTYNQS